MLNQFQRKELIFILFFTILFVLASVLSSYYADFLKDLVAKQGMTGIFFYVLITTLAVLVAPVSTLPLLPLAVVAWGSFWAAFLSVLGWVMGAMLAFWVARKYGEPIVSKFTSVDRLERYTTKISEQNFFWMIVIARIIFPVDVLSYALGLFTKISWSLYFWATLIGIIPFAFFYAYFLLIPIIYQVIGAIVFIFLVLINYQKIQQTFLKKTN